MHKLLLPLAAALTLAACNFTPVKTNVIAPGQGEAAKDFTVGESNVCKLHKAAMTAKVVKLEHGMKGPSPMDEARQRLFPHADEPYQTGYCIPIPQTRGSVWVCDQCTKARSAWVKAHPKEAR